VAAAGSSPASHTSSLSRGRSTISSTVYLVSTSRLFSVNINVGAVLISNTTLSSAQSLLFDLTP